MSNPKEKSQESITAAQPPEPLDYADYHTPPPKKRNITPPPAAAAAAMPMFGAPALAATAAAMRGLPMFGAPVPDPRAFSFGRDASDCPFTFGGAPAAPAFPDMPAPVQEVKLMSSDAAYDQAINFGGNLTLARINTIIDGVSASGGMYCSIKNKYMTREMIDKLREASYHFHITERQACPHCELPINVDGYICWCKGVIHDTPGIVIKNMCSCIAH